MLHWQILSYLEGKKQCVKGKNSLQPIGTHYGVMALYVFGAGLPAWSLIFAMKV